MPSGNISFPGITAPQYAVCTRTIGARPDVNVIYAQPQPGTPDCSGTATFQINFNGVTITMNYALCDSGTLQVTTHGHTQVFEIKDRRWLWEKSNITRAWNVVAKDGSIVTATQRTLRQIVSDIFAAMGELSPDLSAIVSDEKPEIIADHDACVDLLEEILYQRGYVISLQSDDTVKVYVRGRGTPLPANGDVVNANISINPPQVPYYLTCCMAKTLVQSMLMCRAVGLDTDGTIKPATALSYIPAGGWDGTDFDTFNNIANPKAKECAILSVGLWYQVYTQADGTNTLNRSGTNYLGPSGEIYVTDASQYLPIEANLLSTYTDNFGNIQTQPAYVSGKFFFNEEDGVPPRGTNTPSFTRVDRRDWTLDRTNGIIKFKRPAVKVTPGDVPIAGTKMTFADVYLTCTYSVHDTTTYIKDRLTRRKTLGGVGEDLVKISELQRTIVASYTSGTSTVSTISDSKTAMNEAADLFLANAANSYQTVASNVLLYRGIYPFNTDGVCLQLRWDCAVPGPCPWGTHVAQNAEALPMLPTSTERGRLRKTNRTTNPMNNKKWRFHQGQKKL